MEMLFQGEDDLRQDAVMQQVFNIVNTLLEKDPVTSRSKLLIRTYKVFNEMLSFKKICNQKSYNQKKKSIAMLHPGILNCLGLYLNLKFIYNMKVLETFFGLTVSLLSPTTNLSNLFRKVSICIYLQILPIHPT